MKHIWSPFPSAPLINNAEALKTGMGVCVSMWINSLCINFDSNLCVYPEFSNFRKVKINHLWDPMHQEGTASCFVMWGDGEFVV